jgi:hypothetical protein
MEIRNLSLLDTAQPDLKKFAQAVADAAPAGRWDYIKVTEAYRSPAVQAAYYAQSRETTAEVNRLRSIAGLKPISDAQNVWNTNARAGRSAHGAASGTWKGAAFDWYAIKDGKFYTGSDWYDLQKRIILNYPTLKMGITFGDPPHVEFKDYRAYLQGVPNPQSTPDEPDGIIPPPSEKTQSVIMLSAAIFFLTAIIYILLKKYAS